MLRRAAPLAPLLLPVALLAASLGWGLPSDRRTEFVLADGARRAETLDALDRDTDRILATKQTLWIPEEGDPAGELPPSERLKSVRRLLLFSENPDEMFTLAGVAAMARPESRLDPKAYSYGTVYFWSVAAALKAAHLAGAVDLVPSARHYLERPSRMGRLYLAGRALNLAFLALLLAVAFLSARRLGLSVRAAAFAAASVGCAPAVLINGAVLKPHLAAAAFGSLAFLHALRFRSGARPRDAFLALLASAVAAAFQYTAALLALFPLVALALSARDGSVAPRRAAGIAALGGAAGVVAFLALNPFLILSAAAARADITAAAAMHGVDPLRALPVAAFLVAVAAGPGLVACLVGRLAPGARGAALPADWRWCAAVAAVLLLACTIAQSRSGFLGVNSRFCLVALPPALLLALCLPAADRRAFAASVAVFAAAGLYVGAQHVLATRAARPHFAAAEWIARNVPDGARLYVRDRCTPAFCPPIDVTRRRVTVPPRGERPDDGWLLQRDAPDAFGPPAAAWAPPLPYFRASHAEQSFFIYPPRP